MRALGLAGLSVTMPHKAAVVAGLDRLSPTAARLGRRQHHQLGPTADGRNWWATAPTGPASSTPFGATTASIRPAGAAWCWGGGAARAVSLALAEAGAGRSGRRPAARAAAACAALAGAAGRRSAAGPALADGRSRLRPDRQRHARSAWPPATAAVRAGPGCLARRPVRGRPHLRPGHHPVAGRGPSRGAPPRPTGSACSSTRRPARSRSGPAGRRRSRPCRRRRCRRWPTGTAEGRRFDPGA